MQRSVVGFFGAAAIAVLTAYVIFTNGDAKPFPDDLPEMRALPGGVIDYRVAGDFRRAGRATIAPKRTIKIPGNLEIMRYPVSQETYAACVADGACKATHTSGKPDLPQTRVNYFDALDVARWQSARTGQKWRLPTGQEWAYAAAEKYAGEPLDDALASDDPAQRWLQAYRLNAKQRENTDSTLQPFGAYGDNSLGVSYLGGNVWEWTTSCFESGELNANTRFTSKDDDYCGVRIAQGLHRAFIIDFIRDASVGGCAVGLPPDHLAIRLVREN